MSVSVGRYSFLSWLRRGIGTRVGQDDRLGLGASGTIERATVDVPVLLNGDSRAKTFALIGPGDIPVRPLVSDEQRGVCECDQYDRDKGAARHASASNHCIR